MFSTKKSAKKQFQTSIIWTKTNEKQTILLRKFVINNNDSHKIQGNFANFCQSSLQTLVWFDFRIRKTINHERNDYILFDIFYSTHQLSYNINASTALADELYLKCSAGNLQL